MSLKKGLILVTTLALAAAFVGCGSDRTEVV